MNGLLLPMNRDRNDVIFIFCSSKRVGTHNDDFETASAQKLLSSRCNDTTIAPGNFIEMFVYL